MSYRLLEFGIVNVNINYRLSHQSILPYLYYYTYQNRNKQNLLVFVSFPKDMLCIMFKITAFFIATLIPKLYVRVVIFGHVCVSWVYILSSLLWVVSWTWELFRQ